MYKNLLNEAKYIQEAWGYGLLEALTYIRDNETEYPSEIRRELRQFFIDGAAMFASPSA